LGIETAAQVYRGPLRGGLYENQVILEILKHRLNRGKRPGLFFYRDTRGNEVDLVIRQGRKLIPIEIKSAATFTPEFVKGIRSFRAAASDRCAPGFVFYNGSETYTFKGTKVLNPILHEGIYSTIS
jgi:predicted AAA+ superfamily ATPase